MKVWNTLKVFEICRENKGPWINEGWAIRTTSILCSGMKEDRRDSLLDKYHNTSNCGTFSVRDAIIMFIKASNISQHIYYMHEKDAGWTEKSKNGVECSYRCFLSSYVPSYEEDVDSVKKD